MCVIEAGLCRNLFRGDTFNDGVFAWTILMVPRKTRDFQNNVHPFNHFTKDGMPPVQVGGGFARNEKLAAIGPAPVAWWAKPNIWPKEKIPALW